MDDNEIKIVDETTNTTGEVEKVVPQSKDVASITEDAVTAYENIGVNSIQQKFMSGETTASEAGKDVAHLMFTAEAMQDTDDNKAFHKKFSDIKKDELVESAKKELAEEEARKIAAKQHKAEAFYISYRPILEFDLDHLLVKNSTPRPKYIKVLNKETGKKEKVLAPDQSDARLMDEKPKHTYQDRSYGIALMIMMLAVLTLPYFLCTLILSFFNAINYVFVAISRFSKPAFYICATIAGIAILGIFIYVVLLCIEGAFNVDIIPDIKV